MSTTKHSAPEENVRGCVANNSNPSKLQLMAREQNFTLGRIDAAIATLRGITDDQLLSIATGLRLEATDLMVRVSQFKERLAHEYEFVRYKERESREQEHPNEPNR